MAKYSHQDDLGKIIKRLKVRVERLERAIKGVQWGGSSGSGGGSSGVSGYIAYTNVPNVFTKDQTIAGTLGGINVENEPFLQNFTNIFDANPQFKTLGDGKLEWGEGGSTPVDTNLYRSSANALRTDDSFIVGGNLTVVGSTIGISEDSEIVLYPEDYGAVGDGVTDDTDAWQDCLDAAKVIAASSGAVKIKMKPVAYLVDSAPRTDRDGYCILSLVDPSGDPLDDPILEEPDYSYPNIIIEGSGGLPLGHRTARSRFKTTRNDTYSGTYGQPSIIGGATRENNGNSQLPYTGYLKLVGVGFDMPDGCRLGAIDAISFSGIITDNVETYATDGEWVPSGHNSNTASFGIRLPTIWGTWIQRLKDTTLSGHYAGLVINKMDHLFFDRVYTSNCVVSLGIDNTLFQGGHSSMGGYVTASECNYIISGISQTSGAISLTGSFPTKSPQIDGLMVSFESFAEPLTNLVLDANNLIYGRIIFSRFNVLGNVFDDPGPLSGAGNLDFSMVSHGNMVTRRNFAPPDNQVMDSQISMWFDNSSGAPALKAKAKDGAGNVWTPTFAPSSGANLSHVKQLHLSPHIGLITNSISGFDSILANYKSSGAINPNFFIYNDGSILWGDGSGSSAADVKLYRQSADKLRTDDDFYAKSLVAVDPLVWGYAHIDTYGDTWPIFGELGGNLVWGEGGSSAVDTTLYRSSASLLRTEDALQVGALIVDGELSTSSATSLGAVPVLEQIPGGMGFGGIEFYGTSMVGYAASNLVRGMSNRIGAMLHAEVRDFSIAGGVLSNHDLGIQFGVTWLGDGGWAHIYNYHNPGPLEYPYTAKSDGVVLWHGINDLGVMGTTYGETPFKNCLRAAISRIRAASVFEETDASVAYGGSGTWNTTAGGTWPVKHQSGTSYKSNTTVGGTVTISVPSDFPGGEVALSFLCGPTGQGAAWTFSGDVSGTLDTRNVQPKNVGSGTDRNMWTPVIKRFTLPAGAATIIATTTAVSTAAYFDCWWIEAENPPLIDCPNATYATSLYSDASVDTLNTWIDDIVSEFDSNVFISDLNTIIDYSNDLADQIHLNDQGAAKAATVIVQDFLKRTRTIPRHAEGSADTNFITRYPGTTYDNTTATPDDPLTGRNNVIEAHTGNVVPLTLRSSRHSAMIVDHMSIENRTGDRVAVFNKHGSLRLKSQALLYGFGSYTDVDDTWPLFGVIGGALNWGQGGSSAVDVALYRYAADMLITDSQFMSSGGMISGFGKSSQVALGFTQPYVTGPGITFGQANDVNLYRSQTDVLTTWDTFTSSAGVIANWGAATQAAIGYKSTGVLAAGLVLGQTNDTNLYRSSANALKTDDSLEVVGDLKPETLVAPTFSTGWSNFGGGYNNAGYYKFGGRVFLTGTVKNGGTGTGAIFTLPPGYRPPGTVAFRVPIFGSTGDLSVTSAGVVTDNTFNAASKILTSIDQVSFRVD